MLVEVIEDDGDKVIILPDGVLEQCNIGDTLDISVESNAMDKEIEMKTVVLNVNDQVVDKLMWFLGHFNKDV